jgi:hypothetical protein
MANESERTKILEMIEDGTITPDEGLRLLQALGDVSSIESESSLDVPPLEPDNEAIPDAFGGEVEIPPKEPPHSTIGTDREFEKVDEVLEEETLDPISTQSDPDDLRKWKRWWFVPLWIGAGITVIGGLLMYWAWSAGGFGFWFACSWFPFLLGVAVLALAWGSRSTPWLHVRIHQKPGERPEKIAISFPIPIRLTAWGLRTFGHFIPNLDATGLDEVILALGDIANTDAPLTVDVDEGENGERVQVFIG